MRRFLGNLAGVLVYAFILLMVAILIVIAAWMAFSAWEATPEPWHSLTASGTFAFIAIVLSVTLALTASQQLHERRMRQAKDRNSRKAIRMKAVEGIISELMSDPDDPAETTFHGYGLMEMHPKRKNAIKRIEDLYMRSPDR